jgi:precorrin-6B methylase 2
MYRIPRFCLPALLVASLFPAQSIAQTAPKLDVPYVPTPEPVVARMLEMANVQPEDHVVDLGSGDGRIAIASVKDRGAKSALGVDLNPERIEEAEANAQKAGVADKVTFEQGDLFKKDISDANVLTMYLLPRVNMQLRPVILEEMEPGTRIVSHAFSMEDWEADQTDVVDGRYIYLWIVPAKVQGQWQVKNGEQAFTLELAQTFQNVKGEATVNGQPSTVEGKLDGERIHFTLGEQRFIGIVDGDEIKAVSEGGAVANWSATRS